MSGISIGIGGAWKTMANLSLGVGGAWKQVQKVSIGVGGVWKDVWIYLTVTMPDTDASRIATIPTNAVATLSIYNDGTWEDTNVGGGTSTGTWLTAGDVSQVEVFLSGTGDTPTGSALDTWLSCSTSRAWTLTETSDVGATKSFSGTLQFRDATSLAVLDTAAITITATTQA